MLIDVQKSAQLSLFYIKHMTDNLFNIKWKNGLIQHFLNSTYALFENVEYITRGHFFFREDIGGWRTINNYQDGGAIFTINSQHGHGFEKLHEGVSVMKYQVITH